MNIITTHPPTHSIFPRKFSDLIFTAVTQKTPLDQTIDKNIIPEIPYIFRSSPLFIERSLQISSNLCFRLIEKTNIVHLDVHLERINTTKAHPDPHHLHQTKILITDSLQFYLFSRWSFWKQKEMNPETFTNLDLPNNQDDISSANSDTASIIKGILQFLPRPQYFQILIFGRLFTVVVLHSTWFPLSQWF